MKELYKEKKKRYKHVILTLRKSYLLGAQADFGPAIRENIEGLETAEKVYEDGETQLRPSFAQLLGTSVLEAHQSSILTPTMDREYFDNLIYDINTDSINK